MTSNEEFGLNCVEDFEENAAKILPKMAWDYFRSGADDEETLRRNRTAFKKYTFYLKGLIDSFFVSQNLKIQFQNFNSPSIFEGREQTECVC